MIVTCPMDAGLLEEIEAARGRKSRSQFIREAVAEKLRGLGMTVPDDIVFPPDRAGGVRVTVKGVNHGVIVGKWSAAPTTVVGRPAASPRSERSSQMPSGKRAKKQLIKPQVKRRRRKKVSIAK